MKSAAFCSFFLPALYSSLTPREKCGLVAYYIALIITCILPAQGPYVTDGLPPRLLTASLQHSFLLDAARLYHHQGWLTVPRAYYPAFPSLHVAQPLIAAWSLRRWRIVSALICLYCAVLGPAILILEWHYLVDILAGVALAAATIALVAGFPRRNMAYASSREPGLSSSPTIRSVS